MHGTASTNAVRLAHRGVSLRLATPRKLTREAREESEVAQLTPGAAVAYGAGTRAVAEPPDPFRTCFERDRDRILHSSAFRRLAGKTQVFLFPDDHQRTRLTHALEVAQVATSIARAVGLNVALTEAIALGHDCGHGPGGHASEDALSPFVPGGFDHAVWGADVALASLNLCQETLDGIRNHSWSRPAPQTLEGEVVSWADRIAYVCHDFEDAVTAGVVRAEQLPREVIEHCGTQRRQQLAVFINGVVRTAIEHGVIGLDAVSAGALARFRKFNYDHIYLRPASRAQAASVISALRALVEFYAEHPVRLPRWPGTTDDGQDALSRAVTSVAAMTDRYALQCAQRDLGWSPERLGAFSRG
jgi:dGTPase